MAIDGRLLEILCCPVSKTPLMKLPARRMEKLNRAIKDDEVLYVSGESVSSVLRDALITEDSKVIYAVIENIPILLEEKGIGTTQFADF